MSASEATGGVEVPAETKEALSKRVPERERWRFLGRENHYGFDYLIYVLVENPRHPRTLGTRWARVVQ